MLWSSIRRDLHLDRKLSGNGDPIEAGWNECRGFFSVGQAPFGIAFDGTNIWVAGFTNGQGSATKLLASDGALLGSFTVGRQAPYGMHLDRTPLPFTTALCLSP